jgi:hypothetical protein
MPRRVLLLALTLACQPRPKALPLPVPANTAPTSEPSTDSGAPKLADFEELSLDVAFHLRPDQKTIADFSLQLRGPPDRHGRCPSCLDASVEIDGQPFRSPYTAEPPRRCTFEQTTDSGVRPTYPRCSSGHDSFVRYLDPALLEPRRADARTTFRVSDGATTFTAKFLNLFAVRDLLLTKPKDGVLDLTEGVELALFPNTDGLDTVSGVPAAEVLLPDGSALSLVPDGEPERLRFQSNGDWMLMRGLLLGPATLVVRNVRHEVRAVVCSGPRFCTAVVPDPTDEKRFAVTLAL